MLRFNKLYLKIMEDMGAAAVPGTTAQALGPAQAHPTSVGQSGDFYVPGDARNIWGSPKKFKAPKKKKTKFKAPGFKESEIIRRTLPGM